MYTSVSEWIYRIFRDFPGIHSFDRLLLLGLQCKEKKTMINHKINVSQREKTFLWTCAPSEDSDSRRVIRFFTKRILNLAKDAKFLHADNEDSDQNARMRFESPLEYVFSRCGSNYVGGRGRAEGKRKLQLLWVLYHAMPVCHWIITKTCLYNIDPLKPHFYIVKLGITGAYIIFLISAQKHKVWVLVRTASQRRF